MRVRYLYHYFAPIVLFACSVVALAQDSISNGQIVTGGLTGTSIDTWTFSASQGETACMGVSPTSVSNHFYPAVKITDASGSIGTIVIVEEPTGTGTCIVAPHAGSYYGLVENYSGSHYPTSSFGYSLNLSESLLPFVSTGGSITDGNYNGTIVDSNTELWDFSVNAGDHVTVSLADPGASIYVTPEMGVYCPSVSDGGNYSVSIYPEVSGTCVLMVFDVHSSFNTTPYTLTLAGATGSNPLSVSSVQLNVIPGQSYSYNLQAIGGSGKYSWSVVSGFPNQWFSFNSSGHIASLTQTFSEYRGATAKKVPVIPDPGTYKFTVAVNDGSTTANGAVTMVVSCGDADKDDLINQYKAAGTTKKALGVLPFPVAPACDAMTNSASTTMYFFSQLTVNNDDDWALLRQPLLEPPSGYTDDNPCPFSPTPPAAYSPSSPICPPSGTYGLDAWVTAYLAGNGSLAPRVIASGYRTPDHNAQVGGAAGSRHVIGDAADLKNLTYTQDEWNAMKMAAQKAHASWIEPLSGPCKLGCVHADWRWVPGEYSK